MSRISSSNAITRSAGSMVCVSSFPEAVSERLAALLAELRVLLVELATRRTADHHACLSANSGLVQRVTDHSSGHPAVGLEVLARQGRVQENARTGQPARADVPHPLAGDPERHSAQSPRAHATEVRDTVGAPLRKGAPLWVGAPEGQEGGEEQDQAEEGHAQAEVVEDLAFCGNAPLRRRLVISSSGLDRRI